MTRRSPARELVEYVPFVLALRALGRLPLPLAQATGRLLGHLAWLLLRRRREVALANLTRVWGDRLAPDEIRRIARRSFVSLGLLVADFAGLRHLEAAEVKRRVRYDGWERYLEAKARGRGVLYLAAHFGSWELIPYAQALLGHPMAFIVRPADNPRIEGVIRADRERSGNAAVAKQDALRECLKRLKAGETVGILIDQHVPADGGVPVRFLGQPTHATSALAALALRTGAPVLPAFAIREGKGRHRIVLGPEVEVVRTGDRERDLVETTARFTAVVERFVEEHPDHWLWVHRRFREAQDVAAASTLAASLEEERAGPASIVPLAHSRIAAR